MTAYGVERPTLHVNPKITQQGGLIGNVVPLVLCLPHRTAEARVLGGRQKIRVPVELVVQFHLALNEFRTSNSYLGKQRRRSPQERISSLLRCGVWWPPEASGLRRHEVPV